MAAILAMLVAVCRELRAAGCTGEMVDCFSFNAVKVAIPPSGAASVRAEFPGFLLGGDLYGLAALLTAHGVFSRFTIKAISAAEGTNCIIRDTESLADFYIPGTL